MYKLAKEVEGCEIQEATTTAAWKLFQSLRVFHAISRSSQYLAGFSMIKRYCVRVVLVSWSDPACSIHYTLSNMMGLGWPVRFIHEISIISGKHIAGEL
jgi:hypothetical protein